MPQTSTHRRTYFFYHFCRHSIMPYERSISDDDTALILKF